MQRGSGRSHNDPKLRIYSRKPLSNFLFHLIQEYAKFIFFCYYNPNRVDHCPLDSISCPQHCSKCSHNPKKQEKYETCRAKINVY